MIRDIATEGLSSLLGRYGMKVRWVADGAAIPGSYWGDSEAGVIANELLIRSDTPLHSALHEACHYVCMDQQRRSGLHTDAGGGYDEENGVNYLQTLLSDLIPECGQDRMFADMDAWGYSYRLGSARAWFEQDADDARLWLVGYGLIDEISRPTWKLRQ
ncbi:MAG: hypothetical protein HY272_02870 [Gammaproteobacteria bacterium]|nr:hypothetical protein [Gammaproteobacteria bacterium]